MVDEQTYEGSLVVCPSHLVDANKKRVFAAWVASVDASNGMSGKLFLPAVPTIVGQMRW